MIFPQIGARNDSGLLYIIFIPFFPKFSVATEDVRANVKGEAVYLYCSIRGFDTNIPFLDYHWYYKEQTIMTNHKYDIVSKEGALQLTINEPGKLSDTKLCHFTLWLRAFSLLLFIVIGIVIGIVIVLVFFFN